MFGFIKDISKFTGEVVGTVTGPIIGISYTVIAETIGITKAMVEEAVKAGCKTYEEIRDFHKLD